MSKMITSFFFLSTTLLINTILPMQQLTKREAQVKAQKEVESLVGSFKESDFEDGPFSPLAKEIVKKTFDFIECEYLWEEIIQLVRARRVCKRWLCILSSMDAIVKQRNVLPLHFAAMRNNEIEIMYLKMNNINSLLEPDCRGFRAAHYALATKSHDALRMLKIGHALDTERQDSEKLKPFVVNDDEESLKILNAAYDQKCTVEQLSDIVKRGNIVELETVLARISDSTVIMQLPFELLQQYSDAKSVMFRLMFALSSVMESDLFDVMDCKENPHDDFFRAFKDIGANPNAYDEKDRTLLVRACTFPDLQPTLAQLLTCEGIDVNLPSKNQNVFTPLHVAVLCNNIQAAQKLLELKDAEGKYRVNINAKCGDGYTPLRLAAESDNTIDLLELLMQSGADINEKCGGGCAPINFAAENGYVKILQALVSHKDCNIEIMDNNGDTPLGNAVIGDQLDCVKMLLAKRANALCKDKYGNSLLNHAAREGSIKSMEEILSCAFRVINTPNNNGFAPLHAAIKAGHIGCAELLIKAKATVDVRTTNVGDTPLHYAASTNRVDGIELLIKHGACIAAKSNKDAVVNNMHVGGYEPLHYAVHRGHLEAVKTLVQCGANL